MVSLFICCFLFLVCCSSCSTEFEPMEPQFDCSINCIVEISDNELSYAQFVKVRSFEDSLKYNFIDNALISVKSKNDTQYFKVLQKNPDYNYISEKPLNFNAKDLLSLHLEHPQYGIITAEDEVPEKINDLKMVFIDTSLQKRVDFNGNVRYTFSGTLIIQIPGKHLLRIETFTPNDYRTDLYGNPINEKYLTKGSVTPLDDKDIILYNEEFFNANKTSSEYHFSYAAGHARLNQTKLDYIIIKISTVSENLFHYAEQLDEIRKSGFGPFTEPVRMDSNIKNGYGIFGIQHSIIDTFFIK